MLAFHGRRVQQPTGLAFGRGHVDQQLSWLAERRDLVEVTRAKIVSSSRALLWSF